jgi:hypothetical protein
MMPTKHSTLMKQNLRHKAFVVFVCLVGKLLSPNNALRTTRFTSSLSPVTAEAEEWVEALVEGYLLDSGRALE